MAEGATIGALKFILGADTAQLEASTGKASAAMRAAARAGEVAGQQITAAFSRIASIAVGAFAVDRIITFAQESLAAAAAMGRFADQAGMTAREFQGLDFALREAHVPTEQLAQGFAIFSRNLSDLQRNTGPFLDFLRRFAPHFEAQFRAATSTAEAFGVLTDAVNTLGDRFDRVRLLTAAGAEQFTRLANTMRQGRSAIEEQAQAFQGLSDDAIHRAQEIERRWSEMVRNIRLRTQEILLSIADPRVDPGQRFRELEEDIARLTRRYQELGTSGMLARDTIANLNRAIDEQIRLIGAAYIAADQLSRVPPPSAPAQRGGLTPDQIKAASGELARFMAQLQNLQGLTNFTSTAFAGAWERMRAVMAANNESAGAMTAARIQLLMQEDAMRTQLLGNAMLASETLARREQELHAARANRLISETELQRALNLARSEYQMAQLQELQGLGVSLTFQEQYTLSVERANNALARGAISAEQHGRALRAAAQTAALAWMGAAGQIAGSLAQAFPKQKAFAVAAAVINVAEGVTKALSLPFPLNWAQAAAVAAAGMAQINAIKSANPGGSGNVPAVSGAGAGMGTAPAAQASQTLTIDLPSRRYTAEEVAMIIEGVNERVGNGVTLIATRLQ